MAAVAELIRAEADGTLSFGNHLLASREKLDGFEYRGDPYKIKTCRELTRLERNGMLVYESVPGTSVAHFAEEEAGVFRRLVVIERRRGGRAVRVEGL